jgi:hypothetical protein
MRLSRVGRAGTKERGRSSNGRLAPASIGATLFLLCAFAPSAAAAPPQVISTSFSGVTAQSAVLKGSVNPGGNTTTQARFEYGLGECTGSCVKTANVSIGAGTSPVALSAKVEGLAPNTTYHFRVIVTSVPGGPASGLDTTFVTHREPPVFGSCANDAFRGAPQPSGLLPDCRAYEQASPVLKTGSDARGTVGFAHTSPNGDRVTFASAGSIPGAEGGQEIPVYLAGRAGGAWSTQGLLPPESYGENVSFLGWTPDFSQVFDSVRKFNGAGGSTLLSRSSDGGAITTIVPYDGGLKDGFGEAPRYAGTSADGSLALFESPLKLDTVPEAIEGKPNLYLWNRETGEITLAGVQNDKAAFPAGAFAGSYDWIAGDPPLTQSGGSSASYYTQDQNAISTDGKSLYFTAGETGQLYLRRNPAQPQSPLNGEGKCTDLALACTLRVSASEKTNGKGPDNGLGKADAAGTRPAAFLGATPDGKTAFLSSSEKLTNDANTGPEIEPASIARSNLDGSEENPSLLLTDAKGVTTDATHLYWTNPAKGTIGRAELDGKEPEPEFITAAGKPQYVAVDAGHVYWTDAEHAGKGEGTIGRAELDGKKPKPEFITGATNPQGIDADSEYVYWNNAGAELSRRTIGRAKLDGSEANQAFIQVDEGGQQFTPQGLAVNGTQIYAGINGTQKFSYIFRWDINGEAASRKFLFDDGKGKETAVKGIALDSEYLYWTRQGANAIGREKLADFPDFGKAKFEFLGNAGRPLGLAADASHLYWSANQESPPNPGNDLYRWGYDEATNTGKLTDVAPLAGGNGADVVGVLGISKDGDTVYFAANGDLDGAGPGKAGDCKGTVVGIAVNYSGHCGLYVARKGAPIEFIAQLNASGQEGDALDWLPRGGTGTLADKTARVSPDGSTLLFASQEKLTSYDNEGTAELYRYRTGEGIGCISCNSSGEAPVRAPDLGRITLSFLVPNEWSFTLSRNLSADGNRVFFETTDALVGEDTNGLEGCPNAGPAQGQYPVCLDAYEWEAVGAGTCEEDMQGGGCIYLLSSGKSKDASFLFDASVSGDDVFIATRDPFVRQDEDELYDVYDAHVEGGLAGQNEVRSECGGEECKGPGSTPPPLQSPASASFSGPPNPKPKKAKKKKAHHKGKGAKHKKQKKGRAKPNGRAGR